MLCRILETKWPSALDLDALGVNVLEEHTYLIGVWYSMRQALAPLVEDMIVLDRALYLIETHEVNIWIQYKTIVVQDKYILLRVGKWRHFIYKPNTTNIYKQYFSWITRIRTSLFATPCIYICYSANTVTDLQLIIYHYSLTTACVTRTPNHESTRYQAL